MSVGTLLRRYWLELVWLLFNLILLGLLWFKPFPGNTSMGIIGAVFVFSVSYFLVEMYYRLKHELQERS